MTSFLDKLLPSKWNLGEGYMEQPLLPEYIIFFVKVGQERNVSL